MSALDWLFDEVEHHAVLRSHATLVAEARTDLATLRAERDDFERKGLLLCEQNGDLLMQLAKAKQRIEELEDELADLGFWIQDMQEQE